MALRSSMDRIIILLSQSITDKLIESGTLASAHVLHQLETKVTLETSDLLSISINKLSCIPCKVIEVLQIFSQTLIALSQLHKLSVLHRHQTRRNIISSESHLELVPRDLGIRGQRRAVMASPNTSWAI
jgi:hypothetical protein